jgi:hypothetical protein
MRHDNGAVSALLIAGGLAALAAVGSREAGSAARKRVSKQEMARRWAEADAGDRLRMLKVTVDRPGRITLERAASALGVSPQEVHTVARQLAQTEGYDLRAKGQAKEILATAVLAMRQQGRRIKPLMKLVDRQGRVSVQAAARQLQVSPQDTLSLARVLTQRPEYTLIGGGRSAELVSLGVIKRMIDNAGDATPALVYVGTIANELGVSLDEAKLLAQKMAEKDEYYFSYYPDGAGHRASGHGAKTGQRLEDAEAGKLHPVRARFERVLDRFSKQPEVAIRTIDLVLTLLPGSPFHGTSNEPPGVMYTRDQLEEELQGFMGDPRATLDDYGALYRRLLANRELTELLTYDEDLPMNLDRAAWQWGYTEYVDWIATGMRDLIRERDRRIKQARYEGRDVRDAKSNADRDLSNRIQRLKSHDLRYIFDWVEGERPELFGMDFEEAMEASRRWHNERRDEVSAARVRRLKREGKWFDCPGGKHPIKGKVVHTFKNGWDVREMRSYEELQNEGNLSKGGGCLHHCVGEGTSYWGSLQSGHTRFFSLRAPGNVPYVTLEVTRDGSIRQAKGKRNRVAGEISDPSHAIGAMKHLRPMGYEDIDQDLDDEALMLQAFAKKMGFRWSGDGTYVRRRVDDIERRKREAKKQSGSTNRWRKLSSDRRQYRRGLGGRVNPVPR